jgi:hypothetical protein
MSRLRVIVGYVEVESDEARFYRVATTGNTDVSNRYEIVTSADEGYGEARARYWCAADKPPVAAWFALRPIYRTDPVPDDARCETCSIGIGHLQNLFGELL